MPQSRVVRTLEIEEHADHVADAAAVSKAQEQHLSAHEETVQAEEHTKEQVDLRLHHGREAAELVAKSKEKSSEEKS